MPSWYICGNERYRGPVLSSAPAGYVGPGDIASGWAFWGGLRGYSAAYAAPGTNKAIRIVKTSDGTAEQDINILSDGTLDVATIAALGYAVSVMRIYDQSGNGRNIGRVAGEFANMMTLNLTGLAGGTKPVMVSDGTQSYIGFEGGAAACPITQPFSLSTVFARDAEFTEQEGIIGTFEGAQGLYAWSTTGNIAMYSGSNTAPVAAANSTMLAINALANTTASSIMVSGTNTTGLDAGATGATTNNIGWGELFGGATTRLHGRMAEGGIHDSDISANFSALNSNQQTYWGI